MGVVEDQLPTIYQEGLTFMQDNAKIHTARAIKEWMGEMGIELLEWPQYSPDLNPIVHLWRHLKEKCYELNPGLKYANLTQAEKLDKL